MFGKVDWENLSWWKFLILVFARYAPLFILALAIYHLVPTIKHFSVAGFGINVNAETIRQLKDSTQELKDINSSLSVQKQHLTDITNQLENRQKDPKLEELNKELSKIEILPENKFQKIENNLNNIENKTTRKN
jgi:septal ring factor EnvC (AmiA/AmiB activator)